EHLGGWLKRAHSGWHIPKDGDRLKDPAQNRGNHRGHRSAPRSALLIRSKASNNSAGRSRPAAIAFDILISSTTRPCLKNTHRSHTSARSWIRCEDTITAAPCAR